MYARMHARTHTQRRHNVHVYVQVHVYICAAIFSHESTYNVDTSTCVHHARCMYNAPCTSTVEPLIQDSNKGNRTHLAVPNTLFVYNATPKVRTPHKSRHFLLSQE